MKIFGLGSGWALILIAQNLFVTTLSAQPTFHIVQLGLSGSEHTSNTGFQQSWASEFNAIGQVIGHSKRYNGGSADLGTSAWLYNGTTTLNVGMTGLEHTRNDGYQSSYGSSINASGQVVGYSLRYAGGSTVLGHSAWFYNGSSTINIGLTGAEYTGSNGYQSSITYSLNSAGQAIGWSNLYNGGATQLGSTPWIYNGTSTVTIGLTDSEHTNSNGYQLANPFRINDSGQVSGISARFNGGSTELGYSTWIYNGTSTVNIGMVGTEHTRDDGYRESVPYHHNSAGMVNGYSKRFNGGLELGQSVWLYNGTLTNKIGLTDGEHTRNDGYQYSDSSQPGWLNSAGQVIGNSERYNGGSESLGSSAWVFNGTSTVKIGLIDPEHTRVDGFKSSSVSQQNEAGHILGHSERYSGSNSAGRSVWLYNGSATANIGLTDLEHTRDDGFRYSVNEQLNQAGQAAGTSQRFSGSMDAGYSAWLFDGSSTVKIGLTDPEHTRDDGFKYSYGKLITDSGYVIGESLRYSGSEYLGQDAWVYSPLLDTTLSLQISQRSDGYAYSSAEFASEDGVVLGTYKLFDDWSFLGNRAFYWSPDEGMFDLGRLVQGGLLANGWESLFQAVRRDGLGQILGYGQTSGTLPGSMSTYLLVAVPEPSAATLALTGIFFPLLINCRRRKSKPAFSGRP